MWPGTLPGESVGTFGRFDAKRPTLSRFPWEWDRSRLGD